MSPLNCLHVEAPRPTIFAVGAPCLGSAAALVGKESAHNTKQRVDRRTFRSTTAAAVAQRCVAFHSFHVVQVEFTFGVSTA
jgi:hypothetical protein